MGGTENAGRTCTRTGRWTAAATIAAVVLGSPGAVAAQSGVVSDLGDGVKAAGADAWDVLTFPKLFDAGDWVQFAGVLAVGGVLYTYDEEIQDALRDRSESGWRKGLRETGDFFEPVGLMKNTLPFYAGGVAVGYLTDWETLQWIGQDLIVSHLISTATRKPIVKLIGRARPSEGLGAYEYEEGSGESFPSGHAASIVQVATVISHHVDAWPVDVALWGIAGAVAFQRVDAETHWTSDTFIGAAWGWGISKIVLDNADRRRGLVRPIVDPRTGMAGLSIPVGF